MQRIELERRERPGQSLATTRVVRAVQHDERVLFHHLEAPRPVCVPEATLDIGRGDTVELAGQRRGDAGVTDLVRAQQREVRPRRPALGFESDSLFYALAPAVRHPEVGVIGVANPVDVGNGCDGRQRRTGRGGDERCVGGFDGGLVACDLLDGVAEHVRVLERDARDRRRVRLQRARRVVAAPDADLQHRDVHVRTGERPDGQSGERLEERRRVTPGRPIVNVGFRALNEFSDGPLRNLPAIDADPLPDVVQVG